MHAANLLLVYSAAVDAAAAAFAAAASVFLNAAVDTSVLLSSLKGNFNVGLQQQQQQQHLQQQQQQ